MNEHYKVHYCIDPDNNHVACNHKGGAFTRMTDKIEDVTCGCCKRTKVYKEALQKKESERPIEEKEWRTLGSDLKPEEFEVLKYKERGVICITACKYKKEWNYSRN